MATISLSKPAKAEQCKDESSHYGCSGWSPRLRTMLQIGRAICQPKTHETSPRYKESHTDQHVIKSVSYNEA
jgi:hypothetical protein